MSESYSDFESAPDAFAVKLDAFEGPLDLLLHLIKKNEVSINDIPIALITAQYLQTIELLQELNLDIAGEFLVMAATLIHVKSKMLLPRPETAAGVEGEEEDPRDALVRGSLASEIQAARAADEREQRFPPMAPRAGRRDGGRRLRAELEVDLSACSRLSGRSPARHAATERAAAVRADFVGCARSAAGECPNEGLRFEDLFSDAGFARLARHVPRALK